jgi:hypothetical protein
MPGLWPRARLAALNPADQGSAAQVPSLSASLLTGQPLLPPAQPGIQTRGAATDAHLFGYPGRYSRCEN